MATATTERSLSKSEKRSLAVLGLPTLGLALSITVVSTYLPVIAHSFTGSTTVIGVLVGAEGLLALFVPLLFGTWSDQLKTRVGGRLPFVIAGVPLAALALSIMGWIRSLPAMGVVVAVFFFAYFVAYEPYRALYPDLMDDEVAGRAQSSQAIARGAGTGLALLCGGLLMSAAKPLPFIVAAVVLLGATGAFVYLALRLGSDDQDYEPSGRSPSDAFHEIVDLLREHSALRWFLGANALWELSLGALKTFIVLFLTAGMGWSLSKASLAIGATAVIILGAAASAGKLADRFGLARVMTFALWIYGLAMIVPGLTQSTFAIIAVPLIAIGGGVIMALPYAVLMPLMPESAHGALTGYYSLSRGIGTMLGPILAGAAVQLAKGPMSGTHGYAATFFVCAAGILLSIPFMRRLVARAGDKI